MTAESPIPDTVPRAAAEPGARDLLEREFASRILRDLPGDPEDAAIATATLSIARDLGLEVVAEGVETEAQRDFLLERQCAVMQGYLFSRPLPAEAMTELLARQVPAPA